MDSGNGKRRLRLRHNQASYISIQHIYIYPGSKTSMAPTHRHVSGTTQRGDNKGINSKPCKTICVFVIASYAFCDILIVFGLSIKRVSSTAIQQSHY